MSTGSARPCPACGNAIYSHVYRQRFAHFIEGSISDGYEVVACSVCKTCYATGLPDEARFSRYYSDSSKYDLTASFGEIPAVHRERLRDQAAFLAATVGRRDLPVLDVGTATGGLLLALRDAGFTALYGVEPSPDSVRVATQLRGLDVKVGDLSVARSWGMRFGVISFIAVLEHLLDPGGIIAEAKALLLDDGHLYLHVPASEYFREHVSAPFQQFSVEHINYFTSCSLRNLLARTGMDVVAARTVTVDESVDTKLTALEVVCRPTDRALSIEPDDSGLAAIDEYVAKSREKERGISARLAALSESGRPLYVWGTGTNALHLLAETPLAECNILAFIDSNPHYSGSKLAGRTVMSPADLGEVEAPILVASAVSQSEIAAAAIARFGDSTQLLLLY